MSTHIRKTHIRKTQRGWEAITDCPVPSTDNLTLRISTYKHLRGGLITTATVHRLDGAFLSHVVYSDFHMTRLLDPRKRCTEGAVEEQHRSQMGRLGDIMDEVLKHYKLEAVAA